LWFAVAVCLAPEGIAMSDPQLSQNTSLSAHPIQPAYIWKMIMGALSPNTYLCHNRM